MTSEFPEPQSMVINHRFNGRNYLQWSQSVLRYIRGKRKEQYINGAAPQPAPNDPNFDTWFAENNQVMTWLCNSMTVDISEGYLLANTAKEIWDAARRTYSSLDNTAALIHLKRQLRDLRQGNLTVTDYYNALLKLWQQQDLFEVHPWKNVEDAQLYKKIVEEGRVYDFLLGLNDSFEEIRGRLMGIKPLPHLFDVVNHVQFEESRKLLNRNNTSLVESSALAVRGPQEERKHKWCNYCKKKGHIKEECWKLHGRPSTSKPQGHLTSTEQKGEDTTSLSQEELQMLRRILEKQNKSNSLPSVNLVQSGNSIIALNTVRTSDDTWIVDSGATDHMTGNRTLFTTLKLCPEHLQVKVANGVFTKVDGIGTVTLSNSLSIHNVLFVPALTCNLISVSKLTKGHVCRVIFDDDVCLFQDLNSGKTIGTSKEWDGLFYLEKLEMENKAIWNARKTLISSSSQDNNVLLWHCRSGHPSFDYMKHVFPSLFNKDYVPFHCETCQFAKQTRSSYPKQSYRPTTPFQLIHSDIWGPARTKTRTNERWFVTFIDDHTRITWVYLMKEKSEVAQVFKSFHTFVKNQFQTSIKVLRSDNGREYLSRTFTEFLEQQGIHHQTSCPYTPQQNGIAERKNRHLLEVTRTLLMERNVPTTFWGDAVLTAAYLIN